MSDKRYLQQVIWHSLAKLCTKNSENICKSYSEKISGTCFTWTHCTSGTVSCGHGVHLVECFLTIWLFLAT